MEITKFNKAQELINNITNKCNNIIVNSKNSLETAKDIAKEGQKIKKMIETKRKEVTAPLLTRKKEIDDYAKKLTRDLDNGVKSLREQILKFELELERQRQEQLRQLELEKKKLEEEKRIKEEAERKLSEQNFDNASIVDQPSLESEPVVSELEISFKEKELKSDKSTNIRQTWTYEIIDDTQIPRDYLLPDDKKIKAAIALGKRDIPGIKIYQESHLVLR